MKKAITSNDDSMRCAVAMLLVKYTVRLVDPSALPCGNTESSTSFAECRTDSLSNPSFPQISEHVWPSTQILNY